MLTNNFRKNAIFLCLSVAFLFGLIPASVCSAADISSVEYSGTNIEAQNYSRWSAPIRSYLTSLADGSLMRVQAGNNIDGVLVEYYDSCYNLTASKEIAKELPIFGGFYATDRNYFLVTGQNNAAQSADLAVFRITKYDTNWNRLGQAELKDCNTTVPFDAGSLRMDTCGKYLLVRTSHTMYQSNDGYNHQANATIELDMDSMTITDSYTGIMNPSMGYVSHSFNQFLKIEDNHIISLDHGDSYPRALVLLKYSTDTSTGSFHASWLKPCTEVDVLKFSGNPGQNVTGAAVGGFELSASSYLVAGHSVAQNNSYLTNQTRNVFIASVDKSTSKVTINWLTSYPEGDGTTSTPQMVKFSETEFLILWSRDNTVYYTKVNDEGEKISEIYSHTGNLSDCVPITTDGKVIWYTWENEEVNFYEISQDAPEQCTVTARNTVPDQGSTDFDSIVLLPVLPPSGGSDNTDDATSIPTDTTQPPADTTQPPANTTQPPAPSVSIGMSVTTTAGSFKVTKAGGSNTAEAAYTGTKNSSVKKVTIPAAVTIHGVSCKVTSIAANALAKKTKLTTVTIGQNVKSLGKNAFSGCKNLKTITIKSTTLKSVGKNALKGIYKKAALKVPKSKKAAYKKLFKTSTGFLKTMKI